MDIGQGAGCGIGQLGAGVGRKRADGGRKTVDGRRWTTDRKRRARQGRSRAADRLGIGPSKSPSDLCHTVDTVRAEADTAATEPVCPVGRGRWSGVVDTHGPPTRI